MVLPAHISEDRFVRTVLTAVQQNPKLLECNRSTLLAACLKAASDGLLANGVEGAIVSFNTKSGPVAQWMPMLAGILKKVRNSGELASLSAQIVHEKDEFEYWLDNDGEHLRHRPCMEGDAGKIRLTYAIARTKDGGVYIEVMSEKQISAIRDCSRAKDSGPWSGPFADEMRKKSAIRRLSKRLPMSTDLEQVIKSDDDLYEFGSGVADATQPNKTMPSAAPELIPPVVEEPKKSRLSKIVEEQSEVKKEGEPI